MLADVLGVGNQHDALPPLAASSPEAERGEGGAQLGAVAGVREGLVVWSFLLQREGDGAALAGLEGEGAAAAGCSAGVGSVGCGAVGWSAVVGASAVGVDGHGFEDAAVRSGGFDALVGEDEAGDFEVDGYDALRGREQVFWRGDGDFRWRGEGGGCPYAVGAGAGGFLGASDGCGRDGWKKSGDFASGEDTGDSRREAVHFVVGVVYVVWIHYIGVRHNAGILIVGVLATQVLF